MSRAVWALVAAGTVLRLVLAFTTDGQPYDITVLRELEPALRDAKLDVYAALIGPDPGIAWPYPPGFFPLAALAGLVADATGLAYTSLVRLPSIAADAAIALIVAQVLGGRRGVAAAALVALGPSFIAISGYHGQLDNLAILPAVAAVAFWDRFPPPRRALYAGLLIGAGCAVKTTPVFVLLALLPSVRSWREAATMVTAAAAVPLAVMAPFLLSTPDELIDALGYRGFPGTSPLSIIIQPELAEQLVRQTTPNRLVDFLYDRGQAIALVTLSGLALLTTRLGRGWEPAERASLLWLAFYVVTPVFFFQYLVWGLPFLLLARRLRLVVAIQALALLPTVLFYRAPWEDLAVAWPYGLSMLALWLLFVAAIVLILRQREAWSGRVHPRVAELGVVGAVVLLGVGPLVAMLLNAGGDDLLVFAGSDGPFAADQFQYFSWVREYATSLLADNDLDLASSDHVFLHPMFLLSGLGVRLGLSVEAAYLLWKPVAILALLAGCWAYVRRFLEERWERIAAFAIALLFTSPVVVLFGDDVLGASGEMNPAAMLWGYLPAAISVGLMPLFLVGLERMERPRDVVWVSLCGATVAWLHPWQGQVLLVTVVAAVLLLRRRDLPWVRMGIACGATFAPLLYYFVLSLTDPSWELAAEANEAIGNLPVWSVAVALLPLAAVAAFGVRRPESLGEAMLLLWAPSAVLVFLFLSPSFAQHALEGISIPLAVLAARGLAVARRPALAAVVVALAVVPGTVYLVDWLRDTIGGPGQAHYLNAGEAEALAYLDGIDEQPGGVLTSARLGTLIPSATGRRSWLGHPSWTEDYDERARLAGELFSGAMPAQPAAELVAQSGARFVLAECGTHPTVLAHLGPALHFGCARVIPVNG